MANIGSFAANSGSSATTSAEGSEDEHIEEKGKPFLTPGSAAVVVCFSGVVMLLAVDPSLLSFFTISPRFIGVFFTSFLFFLLKLFFRA